MSPFLNQNGIRTFGQNQSGRGAATGEAAAPFRAEPRFKANNRRIRLIIGSQETNFSLTNVSSSGAAGTSEHPLLCDQRVRLIFEGREEIIGIIRWVREMAVGIQFVQPLPPHLVQGPGSSAMPDRAPRYKIARTATIQGEFGPVDAVIRNVSSRGLLIETRQPLRIGQDLEIRCGRMLPFNGQVRWVNGGQAGLLLMLPIALDEFEQQTAEAVI